MRPEDQFFGRGGVRTLTTTDQKSSQLKRKMECSALDFLSASVTGKKRNLKKRRGIVKTAKH